MTLAATKLCRTLIQVEVLSNGSYDYTDLSTLAHDITHGECSGAVKVVGVEELTREQMAAALERQGSDPEFLLGALDAVS